MDALEAIFSRRSCRKFTDQPVTDEQLRTLIEAGMFAPTSHDCRSNRYITVQDRETLNKLSTLHPAWGMMKTATLAIVTCYEPAAFEGLPDQEMLDKNASASAENMLIAATAMGLAGVWLATTSFMGDVVKAVHEILAIPEGIQIGSILALGTRFKPPVQAERFDETKWHKERW